MHTRHRVACLSLAAKILLPDEPPDDPNAPVHAEWRGSNRATCWNHPGRCRATSTGPTTGTDQIGVRRPAGLRSFKSSLMILTWSNESPGLRAVVLKVGLPGSSCSVSRNLIDTAQTHRSSSLKVGPAVCLLTGPPGGPGTAEAWEALV